MDTQSTTPPAAIPSATARASGGAASKRWSGFAVRALMLALAAGLLLAFVGRWNRWVGGADEQSTDDAYLQGDLTPISSRVAGYVREVPVGDFQNVARGATLAVLVDDDYRAQLAQAEANAQATAAQIEVLQGQRNLQFANIAAAQAQVAATQASLTRYQQEAQRQRALLATRIAGTEQLVEQADASAKQFEATVMQNDAQLEGQRRQLAVFDAQIKQQQANLAANQAMRDLARINLNYTRITSPADGVVGQRLVRPGQFVAAGMQVIAVVPLPNLWVIANYKETQMTRVRAGQPATVTVDAFPDLRLRGHVESWSPGAGSQFSLLPADNATGNFTKVVQRIPVKITLDLTTPGTDLLRPGMSVIARIDATVEPEPNLPGSH